MCFSALLNHRRHKHCRHHLCTRARIGSIFYGNFKMKSSPFTLLSPNSNLSCFTLPSDVRAGAINILKLFISHSILSLSSDFPRLYCMPLLHEIITFVTSHNAYYFNIVSATNLLYHKICVA